jgi:hypothetical protein
MLDEIKQLKPYALMTLAERATWNQRAAQLMEKMGGGFASALALAYFRADGTNQARILGAFADLFEVYRNRAFEQCELDEQAAQERAAQE